MNINPRALLCRLCMAVGAAFFLVGCSPREGGRSDAVLAVSIEPQRWILEQIVGDRMEVRTLMANGGDPETYEPTFANLAGVSRSKAYFCLGNLGFEAALVEKIRTNNPGLEIFNVSDSIELIRTESHGHGGHDGVDPHVWSSVRNARVMADNMLKALNRLDPEHSAEYAANRAALDARLDSLDRQLEAILPDSAAFMVWHPSLSYFARDYGLTQIPLGAEGREPSVTDVKRLLNAAAASGAKVFLIQPDFDRNQANALVSGLNGTIEIKEFSPLSYDFDTELINTARAIAGSAD